MPNCGPASVGSITRFGFINWVNNVNWPPIRSEEGLTLETSAFESPYGVQFTLSTQLLKPSYIFNAGILAPKLLQRHLDTN